MNDKINKQLTRLRTAVIILFLLNGLLIFSAFDKKQTKQRFEEIDVERINIIEKDGRLQMVLANKKLLPNAITNGHVLSDAKGNRGPGFLIYNDAGDEAGGYVFGDWGTHFSMDQYKQDQIVYMQVINGENGKPPRTAGYWVAPQSYKYHSDVVAKKIDSIYAIKDKPLRDSLRKQFIEEAGMFNKAFMGKTRDDNTGLFLFNKNTNARLKAY